MTISIDNHFDLDVVEQHYRSASTVIWHELNEHEGILKGTVRGHSEKIYHVNIVLGLFYGIPDEDPPPCTCGCQQVNCKHACALLLAAENKYGTTLLQSMMGPINAQKCKNAINSPTKKMTTKATDQLKKQILARIKSRSNNNTTNNHKKTMDILGGGIMTKTNHSYTPPPQPSVLDKRRSSWLNHLTVTARQHTENQNQEASTTQKSNQCLIYILEKQDYGNKIVARTYRSRQLRKGGFGKASLYKGLFNCLHHDNWLASMSTNDKYLLKLAYVHKRVNVYESEIELDGQEGFELLNKIMATGRCLTDSEKLIPVQKGNKIKGEVHWQPDDQDFLCPVLVDAKSGHPLQLLTCDPLCYLKVSHNQAEYGELTHLPDAPLLSAIMEAPPLDESGAEEASKTIKTLFPANTRKTVKLPEKITSLTVKPQPVLLLDSVPYHKSSVDPSLARATLLFSYNGERIGYENPQVTLAPQSEGSPIIPRQRKTEALCIEQINNWLRPSHAFTESSAIQASQLQHHDLIMGQPGLEYRRDWLQFMTDVLPDLEEQGWLVEIDDNFPFQFEPYTDDDWYAALDETESDWFSLRLGININGQTIDLLPLLARQLNQLPSPEELKEISNDTLIPVALPGGRYLNLTAERLRLICGTLLELFDDRPLDQYPLANHHAEIWQELYDQLGLPWAGGEKLLALSRKLKSFKKLKKTPPGNALQAELRTYQQHGLSWLQFLREYGLNGILADDMGLGKTLQTLAHLQLEKQRLGEKLGPSLVVCPTSLLHNWLHEANCFTPDLKVHIHHGSKRDGKAIRNADLVLTSYGVIQRDFELLATITFHLMVLDEAQAVKNPKAKSAQAVRCLKASHKLCLTGTPMENHLGELWSLFDFLMPGFLGTQSRFVRYYRSPIEKYGNQTQAEKLKKRIAPFMLRRSKNLVAKELPAKTEIIRTTPLKGKQRDLYETIRASMETRVQQEIEKKGLARSQIIILDALLKMRQACCDPSLVKLEQAADITETAKLELLMHLVQPMVEEGRKILIFSQFTSMLLLIETRLKAANIDWVKLTGQTRDRNTVVQQFQNGNIPVFLISLKAGGTGLNLTAADTVIHYDPWWNPAVEDQASDRAHRIGQDKPVFVYKLVTEGTVEEKIQELKEKKKAIADALYGDQTGQQKPSITAEDLNVLFEPLEKQV